MDSVACAARCQGAGVEGRRGSKRVNRASPRAARLDRLADRLRRSQEIGREPGRESGRAQRHGRARAGTDRTHADDQACRVFTSILPDAEPYEALGRTLWEALRNGLAHNFRPDTIRTDNDQWRFAIFSNRSGPHMYVAKGQPHWIHLNIRTCAERIILQIDAYEQELRTNPHARLSFNEKSKRYIKTIRADAARIADALRSVLAETHS